MNELNFSFVFFFVIPYCSLLLASTAFKTIYLISGVAGFTRLRPVLFVFLAFLRAAPGVRYDY